MQTDIDTSLVFSPVPFPNGHKEVPSVDQGVQTINISVQAIQFFHRQEHARTRQGVQTDIDTSSVFSPVPFPNGQKEVPSVDQGVQTVNISVQAIQFFHRQERARFEQGVQTDIAVSDKMPIRASPVQVLLCLACPDPFLRL